MAETVPRVGALSIGKFAAVLHVCLLVVAAGLALAFLPQVGERIGLPWLSTAGWAAAGAGAVGIGLAFRLGPPTAEIFTLDNFEKEVWGATGTVVLLVAVLAYVGPLKSEITPAMVAAEAEGINVGNPFLEAARRRNQRVAFNPSHSNFGTAATSAAPGRAPPPAGEEPARQPIEQLRREGEEPPPTYVPPAPLTPGVQPTVYIGEDAVEKYQHFDDIVDLLSTVSSEDVDYGGETAVQIGEIPEGHPIATSLGLQPGDIIISVNGLAVSRGAARQLYEQLKNQREFTVVIDRAGQRFTVPYRIGRGR
jgi:hypothetical protein